MLPVELSSSEVCSCSLWLQFSPVLSLSFQDFLFSIHCFQEMGCSLELSRCVVKFYANQLTGVLVSPSVVFLKWFSVSQAYKKEKG